jgi:hypothetical protein
VKFESEATLEWTLQACDAKLENIIVLNGDGKLRHVSLAELDAPLKLSGLSLIDAESLFEDE